MQLSLTEKYTSPLDHRSQTVGAWLALGMNPKYGVIKVQVGVGSSTWRGYILVASIGPVVKSIVIQGWLAHCTELQSQRSKFQNPPCPG